MLLGDVNLGGTYEEKLLSADLQAMYCPCDTVLRKGLLV